MVTVELTGKQVIEAYTGMAALLDERMPFDIAEAILRNFEVVVPHFEQFQAGLQLMEEQYTDKRELERAQSAFLLRKVTVSNLRPINVDLADFEISPRVLHGTQHFFVRKG